MGAVRHLVFSVLKMVALTAQHQFVIDAAPVNTAQLISVYLVPRGVNYHNALRRKYDSLICLI